MVQTLLLQSSSCYSGAPSQERKGGRHAARNIVLFQPNSRQEKLLSAREVIIMVSGFSSASFPLVSLIIAAKVLGRRGKLPRWRWRGMDPSAERRHVEGKVFSRQSDGMQLQQVMVCMSHHATKAVFYKQPPPNENLAVRTSFSTAAPQPRRFFGI